MVNGLDESVDEAGIKVRSMEIHAALPDKPNVLGNTDALLFSGGTQFLPVFIGFWYFQLLQPTRKQQNNRRLQI